jgi:hypothetical protein
MTMFRSVAFLLFLASSSIAVAFEEGDKCGVTSADFFQEDFAGNFLVAGEAGCSLGSTTNCYCAPSYGDQERLSEWTWQCGAAVQFGPVPGKICPAQVPVEKQNSLNGGQVALGASDCDTSIHPTGVQEDPVCSYSTCDEGGSESAICACIDKANYGLGSGMQWVCLHSTCDCEEQAESAAGAVASSMAAFPFLMAGAVLGL